MRITVVIAVIFTFAQAGGCSNPVSNESAGTIEHRGFDKALLQGVWWHDMNDISALFFIIGDSLYYTEDQELPFLIELKGDSLFFKQDSLRIAFKIVTLSQDSLIMYNTTDAKITLIKGKSSAH